MKRHSTDWWSFVFGAVFVIIAGGVLVAMETGQLIDLRWLVPALAITAGVGIVAAANNRDRQVVTEPPAPAAARAELDEQVPPVE